MKIYWDEVSDFRNGIFYRLKKGPTYSSALTVGILAHPPFVAFGNDSYWIDATVQPVSGLVVYSSAPTSISIQGNVLTPNIVKSWDEQATGWLGSFSQGAFKQGTDPTATITLTAGLISGTYTIPDSHFIDVGYVAPTSINASWIGTGSPVGQNILSIADFLADPDILSAGSSAFVDVHIEIAVAQQLVSGFGMGGGYSAMHRRERRVLDPYTGSPIAGALGGDSKFPIIVQQPRLIGAAEMAAYGPYSIPDWTDWQKFVPGVYLGRFFKLRVSMTSLNPPQITPTTLSFSFSAIVAPRIDHYVVASSGAGDSTVTFQPDGAAVAGAFNFGPNAAGTPYVNVTILNAASGDLYVQTSLSLSTLVFSIKNAGVRVARNVNVVVEGA